MKFPHSDLKHCFPGRHSLIGYQQKVPGCQGGRRDIYRVILRVLTYLYKYDLAAYTQQCELWRAEDSGNPGSTPWLGFIPGANFGMDALHRCLSMLIFDRIPSSERDATGPLLPCTSHGADKRVLFSCTGHIKQNNLWRNIGVFKTSNIVVPKCVLWFVSYPSYGSYKSSTPTPAKDVNVCINGLRLPFAIAHNFPVRVNCHIRCDIVYQATWHLPAMLYF